MYNAHTTDNQEELFDVVNEQDEVIGQATRRQVHSDPKLIHRAAGAYIFNTHKQLLMQKRSKTKDMGAGLWGFGVGGHVASGDTYELTVRREILEELGKEIQVFPYEVYLNPSDHETEFWGVYIGIDNGPFPDFNTIEADELRFFEVADLEQALIDRSIPLIDGARSSIPKVRQLLESGKVDALIEQYTKQRSV